MACFLVPTGETVVVKAVEKAVEKREQNAGKKREKDEFRIPLSRKLNWLNYMLWGGAILLAFEHIWHGEVTPWFPFLTAMSDPQDASEMFHEMATVGVSMSVLVTGIWAVMCAAADAVVKRAKEARAMQTM